MPLRATATAAAMDPPVSTGTEADGFTAAFLARFTEPERRRLRLSIHQLARIALLPWQGAAQTIRKRRTRQ